MRFGQVSVLLRCNEGTEPQRVWVRTGERPNARRAAHGERFGATPSGWTGVVALGEGLGAAKPASYSTHQPAMRIEIRRAALAIETPPQSAAASFPPKWQGLTMDAAAVFRSAGRRDHGRRRHGNTRIFMFRRRDQTIGNHLGYLPGIQQAAADGAFGPTGLSFRRYGLGDFVSRPAGGARKIR